MSVARTSRPATAALYLLWILAGVAIGQAVVAGSGRALAESFRPLFQWYDSHAHFVRFLSAVAFTGSAVSLGWTFVFVDPSTRARWAPPLVLLAIGAVGAHIASYLASVA